MVPIYCQHFGLSREPFNITPDPSFLYLSEGHKEALAQLVYGIKTRRGFVVLTGEVGTGKTTLIQCLLDELNGTTKTALMFNMVVSPEDLLRYVCEKFDLLTNRRDQRDRHDYANRLERFLLESYQSGRNVALIIDEAQNLSPEILENVRLLSNFETAKDKLLQILLVGQPELGVRLNEAKMRQIKQRVALRHHLSPLSLTECKEYIAKRLEIAGGALSLFSVGSVEAVHSYSSGIPRLVNILCDNALLTAYALRKPCVEPWMIEEVAGDLQLAASAQRVDSSSRDPQKRISYHADRAELGCNADPGSHQSRANISRGSEPASRKISEESDRTQSSLQKPQKTIVTAPRSGSDLVPSQFFDLMIRALTEAMGPMGRFVIYERVAAMGESLKTFPEARLGDLVEETSREILSERLRATFQRLMLDRIRTIYTNGNADEAGTALVPQPTLHSAVRKR
jgi:type II secretory pathway predicted ATPase ExeA